MKDKKGCFSHKTDDWKTPYEIYHAFMFKGYVDCFPYQSKYDELEKEYEGKNLFINPPYSKLNKIVDWIVRQANDNNIALLIPSRTDTRYFAKLAKLKPDIIFIKGRLHFNDSKEGAPFPSMLMLFGFDDRSKYFVCTYDELLDVIWYDL